MIVIITTSHVYVVNEDKKKMKKKTSISDMIGVTQSLISDQTNFIMHFKTKADEELFCQQ